MSDAQPVPGNFTRYDGGAESVARVTRAAREAGLDIKVLLMPASTRTAEEAAAACGCAQAQIVKSLIFERADNGALVLLLIAGDRQADPVAASSIVGAGIRRADPKRVRRETGFSIGNVAPIGHLAALRVFMDPSLLAHDMVWAAAGAANAVFCVAPGRLLAATSATLLPEA